MLVGECSQPVGEDILHEASHDAVINKARIGDDAFAAHVLEYLHVVFVVVTAAATSKLTSARTNIYHHFWYVAELTAGLYHACPQVIVLLTVFAVIVASFQEVGFLEDYRDVVNTAARLHEVLYP